MDWCASRKFLWLRVAFSHIGGFAWEVDWGLLDGDCTLCLDLRCLMCGNNSVTLKLVYHEHVALG